MATLCDFTYPYIIITTWNSKKHTLTLQNTLTNVVHVSMIKKNTTHNFRRPH